MRLNMRQICAWREESEHLKQEKIFMPLDLGFVRLQLRRNGDAGKSDGLPGGLLCLCRIIPALHHRPLLCLETRT